MFCLDSVLLLLFFLLLLFNYISLIVSCLSNLSICWLLLFNIIATWIEIQAKPSIWRLICEQFWLDLLRYYYYYISYNRPADLNNLVKVLLGSLNAHQRLCLVSLSRFSLSYFHFFSLWTIILQVQLSISLLCFLSACPQALKPLGYGKYTLYTPCFGWTEMVRLLVKGSRFWFLQVVMEMSAGILELSSGVTWTQVACYGSLVGV